MRRRRRRRLNKNKNNNKKKNKKKVYRCMLSYLCKPGLVFHEAVEKNRGLSRDTSGSTVTLSRSSNSFGPKRSELLQEILGVPQQGLGRRTLHIQVVSYDKTQAPKVGKYCAYLTLAGRQIQAAKARSLPRNSVCGLGHPEVHVTFAGGKNVATRARAFPPSLQPLSPPRFVTVIKSVLLLLLFCCCCCFVFFCRPCSRIKHMGLISLSSEQDRSLLNSPPTPSGSLSDFLRKVFTRDSRELVNSLMASIFPFSNVMHQL